MTKSYWPGGSEPFRQCSTGQNHCAEVLGQLGVLHVQQLERRLKARECPYALGPAAKVRPMRQVECANLRKGHVAITEEVGDGRLGGTEIAAIDELGIQFRYSKPQVSWDRHSHSVGRRQRHPEW